MEYKEAVTEAYGCVSAGILVWCIGFFFHGIMILPEGWESAEECDEGQQRDCYGENGNSPREGHSECWSDCGHGGVKKCALESSIVLSL
jgi:hypothetical protein